MQPIKGRGAPGNGLSSRFNLAQREADGDWLDAQSDVDGGVPPLRTSVTIERPKTILSRNSSPDIPFDHSLNPYRGCEHGCIYCYARPSHAFHDLSPGLDFESRLFAKPDAPALFLRRMLNRLTDWMHGFFEPAPRPGDAEEDENRDEEEEEEEDGGDGDSDDDEDGGDAEGAAHDAATIGEAGDEAEEDAQPRPCEDGRADWRGEGGHFPPEGDATPPASPVPRIRSL
jgi:hypothetical protein